MDKDKLINELQRTQPVAKTLKEIVKDKGLDVIVKDDNSLASNLPVCVLKAQKKGPRTREDYRPTKSQLTLINQTTLEDASESTGYVFRFQATNTKNTVDRGLQRLSDRALKSLATQAIENKIPFLVSSKADCEDHTWKAINSYGFVFDAMAKDGGLFYDVYVPDNERTKDILDAVFSAQINKLSIGFSMSEMDLQCDSCKRAIVDADCPHQPGSLDEKGHVVTTTILDTKGNYEISGVAVPCQQQAHIQPMKSLDPDVRTFTYIPGQYTNPSIGVNNLISGLPNPAWKAIDLTTLGRSVPDVIDAVKEVNEMLEQSDSDKINIGKNTIEDNTVMSDDNKTVTLDENDKLCKVAEQVKTQAVAEIKSLLEDFMAKQAENLAESLKSLDEKISILSAVKALDEKADLTEKIADVAKELAEVKSLIKVEMSVPGSKTLVDMATASSDKKTVSADADLLTNILE